MRIYCSSSSRNSRIHFFIIKDDVLISYFHVSEYSIGKNYISYSYTNPTESQINLIKNDIFLFDLLIKISSILSDQKEFLIHSLKILRLLFPRNIEENEQSDDQVENKSKTKKTI